MMHDPDGIKSWREPPKTPLQSSHWQSQSSVIHQPAVSTIQLGSTAVDIGGDWEKRFKAGPDTGRFAATSEGLVGWVPKDAREGDLVVLLYGSNVPLVLRRVLEKRGGEKDDSSRNTTYYRLVGECYIQGIMAGEAMMTTASSNRLRTGRGDDRKGHKVEDTREITFALVYLTMSFYIGERGSTI